MFHHEVLDNGDGRRVQCQVGVETITNGAIEGGADEGQHNTMDGSMEPIVEIEDGHVTQETSRSGGPVPIWLQDSEFGNFIPQPDPQDVDTQRIFDDNAPSPYPNADYANRCHVNGHHISSPDDGDYVNQTYTANNMALPYDYLVHSNPAIDGVHTNGINHHRANQNIQNDSVSDFDMEDDDRVYNYETDDSGIEVGVHNNANYQLGTFAIAQTGDGNNDERLVSESSEAPSASQLVLPRRATTPQIPAQDEIESHQSKAFWFSMLLSKEPPICCRGILRRVAPFTWHPSRVPFLGRRYWRDLMQFRLDFLQHHNRIKTPTFMRWEMDKHTLWPTLVRLETRDEPIPEPPFAEHHEKFYVRPRSRSIDS